MPPQVRTPDSLRRLKNYIHHMDDVLATFDLQNDESNGAGIDGSEPTPTLRVNNWSADERIAMEDYCEKVTIVGQA